MIQNISHTARKSSVREDENMIRVCFVCHGNILKSPGKASKINGSAE